MKYVKCEMCIIYICIYTHLQSYACNMFVYVRNYMIVLDIYIYVCCIWPFTPF